MTDVPQPAAHDRHSAGLVARRLPQYTRRPVSENGASRGIETRCCRLASHPSGPTGPGTGLIADPSCLSNAEIGFVPPIARSLDEEVSEFLRLPERDLIVQQPKSLRRDGRHIARGGTDEVDRGVEHLEHGETKITERADVHPAAILLLWIDGHGPAFGAGEFILIEWRQYGTSARLQVQCSGHRVQRVPEFLGFQPLAVYAPQTMIVGVFQGIFLVLETAG